jgi:hypothetical protein
MSKAAFTVSAFSVCGGVVLIIGSYYWLALRGQLGAE